MQQLDPTVQEKINAWLVGNYDQDTKDEIIELLSNKSFKELTDAFYKDLEFGTGGLRGIMGIGTNRINKYTIGMATQGLANYLKKTYPDEQIKVAIAHDSRNNADFFTGITADVFSANGIQVYLFPELRPTPQLSYAIRELGCHSGVVLTASHNPKEYSGYKAYWIDGGQVLAPHDKNIIAEVSKIKKVDDVFFEGNPALIEEIGVEMDERYIQTLAKLSISKEAIKRQHDLKIVFSPIHGTGITLVPKSLEAFGFSNIILVEEQCTPDGNFPTVVYPNPEEKEAMTMALKKAEEVDADLVMATDPDADRVGIAIKNDKGEFVLMNGNQTGSLLINYMLNAWEEQGKLTGNEYIVKTIVSSYLMDKIAASKNVACYNTLTGFKFIGALMTQFEGKYTYIAGGEESYGYLVGSHARDKDAIISCAILAEMAAYYKDKGMSMYDALVEMSLNYGLYKEKLISITRKGKEGAEEIQAMMEKFRTNPPESLGGSKVSVIKDYLKSVATDLLSGDKSTIDLPKSNVIQMILQDGSIISARPSGTEPKIKFYCSVNDHLASKDDFDGIMDRLDNRINQLMKDLGVA